ncbi:MAG TPA: PAS domain-containing protein [Stellaceae bacterium]|nr:PAS domain-containing protein [Stellaceae bacterium]
MDLHSPALIALYDLWAQRRAGRAFPARHDFDPADLKPVLGLLSIFEVHRNPLRFKCRLHGSTAAQRLGFDMTGKFVDEAPKPKWSEGAGGHFKRVAMEGAPSAARYQNIIYGEWVLNMESLVLPLSNGGSQVDCLFATVVYYDPRFKSPELLPETERAASRSGFKYDYREPNAPARDKVTDPAD